MTDITVQNLEAELVQASLVQPVLLDIWAPWCGPCRTLGPLLESIEVAYEGRFKLVKLNADDQPDIAGQLSQMFGVRSIPFCVMFKDGQPVDGFVGALPEAQIREFLDKHVPTADQAMAEADVEEAQGLLAEGDTESALEKLAQALSADPGNDAVRYDFVRALLLGGHVEDAREAFEPVAAKVGLDAKLAAVGNFLAACEAAPKARPVAELEAILAANKRDFEARFELAQIHFAAQRWTDAMEGLLEIVMRDKAWNGEAARKTYVAILEMMAKPAVKPAAAEAKSTLEVAGRVNTTPADPVVDQYRRKLSMALF
ncbi:thioredoxin [soil metagenome]